MPEDATPTPDTQPPIDPPADAICILDRDGCVTHLNPAAERLTGWAANAAIGRSCGELLPLARPGTAPRTESEHPACATLRDGATRQLESELPLQSNGNRTVVTATSSALIGVDGTVAGAVVTFADGSARTGERRYRSLVAATSDFVWHMTPEGRLSWISDAWLELVGFTFEEAVGDGWLEALYPDDRSGYDTAWRQAVAAGTVFEYEYRLDYRDGSTRWFFDRVVPVRNDAGTILEWIGVGSDVTREREADEELRRQREQYRTLVESTSAILWEADPETFEFTYVSPEAETLLGYPAERWTREPGFWVEHIHPDDREWAPTYCARATAELRQHTFDYRMIASDGDTVWLRDVVSVVSDGDRPIKLVGVMVDITSTREIEGRLQESRALQEIAGGLARVGGWVVDVATDRIRWSEEIYAIHELDPTTPMTLEERLMFYLPECRDQIRTAYYACARTGTPYDEEARIETANGRRAWVRTIGRAVCDHDGRITQVRGALQDITEQKQAREEVTRLAEQLTNTLESITDAFYTVDRYWCFTYVNSEAERLFSRDRNEVLGKELWTEYPTIVGTSVEHEFRGAVESNRTAEFEYYYPPLGLWLEIRAYPSSNGLTVYLRDISERKRAQDEIEFLALYDPLTQLPNRRLLLDRLDHALSATERTGLRCAILFLDLDHFKTLNDTLGHDIGDRMLQQAAHRLRDCVRRSDTVARFGGDEFAVILERLAADRDQALAQAGKVGEKIRTVLARPYDLGDHERHTTASIGMTLFGNDRDDSADDVMKRADLAMYQAKDSGRGTVRVFDPSMRAAVQSRVALEDALRKALDAGEIVPWFQPQFDGAGRLIGAETLARWLPADRDPVSPAEFIPVAEETGLIIALGDAVLEGACTRIATWSSRPGLAELDVSVNVSARQFHHPDFVEQVRAIVERTGVPTERLWLELTESLLLADVEDTIRKMTALRADGVRFTLDDFGTGYSSLAYLKRLPLDQLKIDQGFVRDALADPNDAAIVRTIIVLAHTMGMQVIAEGVETEAVRAMLAADGCTAYQGFLYSPALPTDRFEEMAAHCRVGTTNVSHK